MRPRRTQHLRHGFLWRQFDSIAVAERGQQRLAGQAQEPLDGAVGFYPEKTVRQQNFDLDRAVERRAIVGQRPDLASEYQGPQLCHRARTRDRRPAPDEQVLRRVVAKPCRILRRDRVNR
jgi:hypothetical protein